MVWAYIFCMHHGADVSTEINLALFFYTAALLDNFDSACLS